MTINDIDTNNSLVNTFSERMVRIIDALPKHAIADTPAKGLDMGDVILALRTESTHERYQRPIRSFYDLSTAHVSPEARLWLEAQAWLNTTAPATADHTVGAVRDGWLVYAPDDLIFGDPSSLHRDLYECAIEARLCGCAYILFDRDAEIVGTLPTFLDDETSTEGFSEEEKAALALIHPEDGLPMDKRTNAEVILDTLDPTKPADRRVLLDDESPTFGAARKAAQAAGKAALEEDKAALKIEHGHDIK